MFESLSTRLQGVFKTLRGEARLTEAAVDAALREIRLALLEADVNFRVVKAFIDSLLPSEAELTVTALLAEGTEGGFRAVLELEPGNEEAIVGLAELLVARGESEQALQFLGRIAETDRTRKVAAKARTRLAPDDDHDATLTALLDNVKADEAVRQQFVDILELMGPDDPRTAGYRKQLTQRLF